MLIIDLGAIQKNWLQLASMTEAKVAGVIKANAYGLGADKVGMALYTAGCREFFLATCDEALAAKSYLPSDAKIYLLGGLRNLDLAELSQKKISPVLCSGFDLERWFDSGLAGASEIKPVLKINTGMNRFGLDESEFARLLDDPSCLKALNPGMIISHLACADDANHAKNNSQLTQFLKAVAKIKTRIPHIRASLSNSSGIFLGKSWHFDLVRPGAAIYGLNPTPSQNNPMSHVLKLSLPILQVRTLESPDSIGYGATTNLAAGARIAVVAGGYADGLHRILGAQPAGILRGCRVNAVGRVSMDSMIFDVSSVIASDEELMKSSIDVVSEQLPIDHLMQTNYQSLGYEVLTSLGGRFKRSYIGVGS